MLLANPARDEIKQGLLFLNSKQKPDGRWLAEKQIGLGPTPL